MYFRNEIKKIKSAGEITIGSPIAEWDEGEMAIEVHGDVGDILTKGESIPNTGPVDLYERKRMGEIKIKVPYEEPL